MRDSMIILEISDKDQIVEKKNKKSKTVPDNNQVTKEIILKERPPESFTWSDSWNNGKYANWN